MKQNLIFDETEQVFTMDFGEVHTIGGSSVVIDQAYNPESENAQSGKAVSEALKTIKVPEKVSELENDSGYLTEHQDISGKADINHKHPEYLTEHQDISGKADKEDVEDKYNILIGWCSENSTDIYENSMGISTKADKAIIETLEDATYIFEFSNTHNTEIRLAEVSSISFTFGNGEYAPDYTSGLSFDSGATPTAIDYTDSGILNWVGTDCTMSDGLSIFQPSANTHYDIVFYFNGTQFIGLVNGFIPSTGNVVSE